MMAIRSTRKGGGGGLPEAPTFMYEPVPYPQTVEELLAAAPQFSQGAWEDLYTYGPKQARLAAAMQAGIAPGVLQNQLDISRQFLPQFTRLQTDAAAQERAATLADIQRLTPQVNAIDTLARGPQNQAIYNELQAQTLAGIDANGTLTQKEQRDTQQAARSADAARGITGGSGSSNREAVEMSLAGSEKQRQQQQQATSFLSLDNSLRTNPFTAIGGMPTPGVNSANFSVQNPGIQVPTYGTPISGQNTAVSAYGANTAQNQLGLGVANAQFGAQQQNNAYELAKLNLYQQDPNGYSRYFGAPPPGYITR